MKNNLLLVALLLMGSLCINTVEGQTVGIGTATPHASAQLDVSSDNKGLLAPRVSLTNVFLAAPVSDPVEGLLIFNTNNDIIGSGSGGKGFYYWTGVRWVKLTGSLEGWSLTGNGFTDTATNFIGTTDNRSLMFRVFNQPAGRIEMNGENLFLGYLAGQFNVLNSSNFTGERNTFLGAGAGRTNVTGRSNTYVGAAAGRSTSSSFGNTMVGAYAGASNSTGQFNTNVGFGAGGQIGDGSQNTALGYQAGSFMGNIPGSQGNVTIGYESGVSLRNGAGNITIGRHAGNGNFQQNGIGSYNIYIGDSSATASNNAQSNIAIGRRSGRNILTGSQNVLIGDSAGVGLTTGSGNVFLGDGARAGTATITNATAIGNRAFVAGNNAMVLGSIAGVNGATQNTNVGIGTNNPTRRLYIQDGASSGIPSSGNSLLVLDKTGGPNYISILNNDFESGLIFAKTPSNQSPFDGGIFYNVSNTKGGMQFRNQGGLTRMVIHDNGNISMGTINQNYKLLVQEGTSTGVIANANSTLVLDKDGSDHYLSILGGNTRQTGILFGIEGSTSTNANGGVLYNAPNNPLGLQFRTGGNNTRMSIASNGDVGLGTTSPQFKLHVNSNLGGNNGIFGGILVQNVSSVNPEATISFKNGGSAGTGINQWMAGLNANRNFAFGYGTEFLNTNTMMVIDSTGNVGIGVLSPTFQLQLSQNSAAKPGSNTWTVSSDERLKKDMRPFEDGLETLEKINPIWFTYTGAENHPQEQFVGATAQAIQQVAPYMITTLKEKSQVGDKLLGVDYGPLQFIMINAIKEQQQVIQAQQKQIDELLTRLEALERKK